MIHHDYLGAVTVLLYHHRRLIRILWIQTIYYRVKYGLKVSVATEVVRLRPELSLINREDLE